MIEIIPIIKCVKERILMGTTNERIIIKTETTLDTRTDERTLHEKGKESKTTERNEGE